jgi:hypothetical protein
MEANAASNAAFATTAEFDPDPEFETWVAFVVIVVEIFAPDPAFARPAAAASAAKADNDVVFDATAGTSLSWIVTGTSMFPPGWQHLIAVGP